MIRTPFPSALAIVLLVLVMTFAAAQQSSADAVAHTATFSSVSVDTLADGKVVVTLAATGEDLAGLATLELQPNGGGTYNGVWAMTVAHADNTDPETGEEPPAEEPGGEAHPHKDFLRLVHRGSLDGSIQGALLTFDAQGALIDFTAPLAIQHGFKEFDGATGSGQATLASLTLTF